MASYRSRTACVVDNGLFFGLAEVLAQSFGSVLYYAPWESAFPKSNQLLVGTGFPGITKIRNIWEVLDEVDLFVFPDVYSGPLQVYLESLGKRVWGSRMGERLELDRVWAKEYLRDLGLDVGPYEVVRGLNDLREYLQDNDGQYVKVSFSRGDFETFYSPNYRLIEPKLDEIEHTLGAKKDVIDFIVEQEITDACESAYDGYSIDGSFPRDVMFGIEVKDRGYVGGHRPYGQLPYFLQEINAALAPTLAEARYRNSIAIESRTLLDGSKTFIIDPCARFGSPPGELLFSMITNWDDIIWEGAEGVLIEPEYAGRWGAELLIHSSWADRNWQSLDYPSSIADFVKLRNPTIIDGRTYVIPQSVNLPEIGAVVAVADTMEGAIKQVRENASKIEGYYIEHYSDALDEASEQFELLDQLGAAREAA